MRAFGPRAVDAHLERDHGQQAQLGRAARVGEDGLREKGKKEKNHRVLVSCIELGPFTKKAGMRKISLERLKRNPVTFQKRFEGGGVC